MSRTETFWNPCSAKRRSAALNTAALVAACASSVSGGSVMRGSVMRIPKALPESRPIARSARQLLHGLLEPVDGEREHPVAHQLLHHPDRVRVVPMPFGGGVQPDG